MLGLEIWCDDRTLLAGCLGRWVDGSFGMMGSALQGDGRFGVDLKMRLKIREGVQGEGRASDRVRSEGWRMTGSACEML